MRVNKTQLSKRQEAALFKQFDDLLGSLSRQQTSAFVAELLGPEERLMLAKRLAIMLLLLGGTSLYKISELLKVSSATAEKVKRKLERGDYEHTIKLLGKNKTDYFKLLDALDAILHLGGALPHYNGLDRYRFLNETFHSNER